MHARIQFLQYVRFFIAIPFASGQVDLEPDPLCNMGFRMHRQCTRQYITFGREVETSDAHSREVGADTRCRNRLR